MAIFAQWVIIGLFIPFISWEIQPWLKGLIVGELGMLPFMIIAFYRSKKSIIPMAIMAAILGTLIAVASEYFMA